MKSQNSEVRPHNVSGHHAAKAKPKLPTERPPMVDCGRSSTCLRREREARMQDGRIVAVASDGDHRFSKRLVSQIEVIAGLGVRGDAHAGDTVKHRSRVASDPSQPNYRQVHLIHAELFAELEAKGFRVGAADLGENVTTAGIDLLALPRGARLRLGRDVVLEVTGLRNPCAQIERFQPGLLAAVLARGPNNEVIRKAGIMAVVRDGGVVRPGDLIEVELPPLPHSPLECV
ncbi:MOSC domain-containing protein [Sphingomonas sp. 1P06PA]|uniref:MOSC domain-containing protein n=1 Tax=Sphingomonas sp. 1P06PA TaxID=554121 RepID=UPI0039A4A19C